jgi:hypothetical protein
MWCKTCARNLMASSTSNFNRYLPRQARHNLEPAKHVRKIGAVALPRWLAFLSALPFRCKVFYNLTVMMAGVDCLVNWAAPTDCQFRAAKLLNSIVHSLSHPSLALRSKTPDCLCRRQQYHPIAPRAMASCYRVCVSVSVKERIGNILTYFE